MDGAGGGRGGARFGFSDGKSGGGEKTAFDSEIYGDTSSDQYATFLPAENEQSDDEEDSSAKHPSSRSRINPSRALLDESIDAEGNNGDLSREYREQYGSGLVNTRIASRETEVGFS